MRYLAKCNHDVFMPGESFYSARKTHSRSGEWKTGYSNKRLTVGANSVVITKIRPEPSNFTSFSSQKSIKDELMKAIMGVERPDKPSYKNKINYLRLESVRQRSDSAREKTSHRCLTAQSSIRQNSLGVVPIVFHKRPLSKRSQQLKPPSLPPQQKQPHPLLAPSQPPKQLQLQRKENLYRRNRQAKDKKLALKSIRFMGQEISPW